MVWDNPNPRWINRTGEYVIPMLGCKACPLTDAMVKLGRKVSQRWFEPVDKTIPSKLFAVISKQCNKDNDWTRWYLGEIQDHPGRATRGEGARFNQPSQVRLREKRAASKISK